MTDFYDSPDNIEQYISMAEGYDGRELIDRLGQSLPAGSTVLELGIGPGVDLQMLQESYATTGSDRSLLFVNRYRAEHPDADLLVLDAVTLETDRRFDAIYSNKVLHHLQRTDLARSFERQAHLLNPGGLVFHSFWAGEGEEEHHGLLFTKYHEETLRPLFTPWFDEIEIAVYTEMETDDSLYALLRKSTDVKV